MRYTSRWRRQGRHGYMRYISRWKRQGRRGHMRYTSRWRRQGRHGQMRYTSRWRRQGRHGHMRYISRWKITLLKIVLSPAALDVNHICLLSLLDLFATLDTTDHSILLSRLYRIFGISGTALSWFQSNVSDRTQVVSVNGVSSAPVALNIGVPQRSMLGPVLFVLSTHSILKLYAITLFYTTVSLMTTNCTSLATFLVFLKSFIQLSLAFRV